MHSSVLVVSMRLSWRPRRPSARTIILRGFISASRQPWLILGAKQKQARRWPGCLNSNSIFTFLNGWHAAADGELRCLSMISARQGFRTDAVTASATSVLWHFSDMVRCLARVRNSRQTGHRCRLPSSIPRQLPPPQGFHYPTGRTRARRGGSARTQKDWPAARCAAQDQTVVCLTPATALEDRSAVRANGAASARNPRRSHWAKAQTAIRRPGRSRNADSRAPWRRAHIRSSRRPAGPRKRLAS